MINDQCRMCQSAGLISHHAEMHALPWEVWEPANMKETLVSVRTTQMICHELVQKQSCTFLHGQQAGSVFFFPCVPAGVVLLFFFWFFSQKCKLQLFFLELLINNVMNDLTQDIIHLILKVLTVHANVSRNCYWESFQPKVKHHWNILDGRKSYLLKEGIPFLFTFLTPIMFMLHFGSLCTFDRCRNIWLVIPCLRACAEEKLYLFLLKRD